MTSPDDTTWIFVAVAFSGTVMTSPDGITWTNL